VSERAALDSRNLIIGWAKETANGGIDNRARSLALAARDGFDAGWVKWINDLFDNALGVAKRDFFAEAEKPTPSILGGEAAEPKPEPKPEEPEPIAAEVVAKAASSFLPDVQPVVDTEVAAPSSRGPGLARVGTDVEIRPKDPMETARQWARKEAVVGGASAWRYWQGVYYCWSGAAYEPLSADEVTASVCGFLDGAVIRLGAVAVPNVVTTKQVSEVAGMVQSLLSIRGNVQPPMWLGTGEPANEWMACRNAAVNVLTGEVREASPDLWVMSSVGWDWDEGAVAPTWEWFLEDVWPGDQRAQEFVEEWVGYCMTEDTRFQKALMLVGPPRSGKGLLTHVIKGLTGIAGYTAVDFSQWTGTNERESLIGTKVAVASDTKLKDEKMWGLNFDAGGLDYKSVGFLLQYIGGDTVSIGRKNIRAWKGVLNTKFIVVGNAPLNLGDRNGVLPTRFLTLATTKDHLKDYDPTLGARLIAELPGIAVRCAKAYRRLVARGRFVQPESGVKLMDDTVAASDWRVKLLRECFVVENGAVVTKVVAHERVLRWATDNGRRDLIASGWTMQKTGALLRDLIPDLSEARPAASRRVWIGLRLR
jgi:putative DNA primase/helicase